MDDVEMLPVVSQMASHVGYNADTQQLCYRHHNHKTTTFKNVPEHVGQAAISASSIGSFYHSNIRGQYDFETV